MRPYFDLRKVTKSGAKIHLEAYSYNALCEKTIANEAGNI